MRASAGDPTAEWVEQELSEDLDQTLAPYLARDAGNGAVLVARISYVYLGSSGGGVGASGVAQDSILGVLVVKGARGDVETPLRAITTYYPNAADQALQEQAFHGRVVALAQAFAGWAPKELGY